MVSVDLGLLTDKGNEIRDVILWDYLIFSNDALKMTKIEKTLWESSLTLRRRKRMNLPKVDEASDSKVALKQKRYQPQITTLQRLRQTQHQRNWIKKAAASSEELKDRRTARLKLKRVRPHDRTALRLLNRKEFSNRKLNWWTAPSSDWARTATDAATAENSEQSEPTEAGNGTIRASKNHGWRLASV